MDLFVWLTVLPPLEGHFRLFRSKALFRCFAPLLSTPQGVGSTCVFSEFRRSVLSTLYQQPPGVDYFAYPKGRISTCICSGSNLNKHCSSHSHLSTWISGHLVVTIENDRGACPRCRNIFAPRQLNIHHSLLSNSLQL